MSLKWADPMPEGGRVAGSTLAFRKGKALVCDPKASCAQTLHITLFFDGTNNNDAPKYLGKDNPFRDSLNNTHSNVARLYNAAVDRSGEGVFRFYIQGVGTPFDEIGEPVYTQFGKSMASGFAGRCIWGYTRILNALYSAIATNRGAELVSKEEARRICKAGDDSAVRDLVGYIDRLGLAHKQAFDEGRHPQTVRQIWINVIGFSRGAAGARVFVNKLINEWAPNGRIGYQTGKYALNYKVNFVGLFDTVASVGPPDSTRATVNFGMFDGHFAFADHGRLNIPKEVNYCYHAFSIHEQRMSFPLDSIRIGDSYGAGVREEVAYPGVHSDVGGGYAPNEQGKGRTTGPRDDSHKLSQIPLHDMYLKAVSYGVPLHAEDVLLDPASPVSNDFALDPATISAFNAWRKTVEDIKTVEDALKSGMGQLLAWRTLRADVANPHLYVTGQEFFQKAHEDPMTPHKVEQAVEKSAAEDQKMRNMRTQYQSIQGEAYGSMGGYTSYVNARQEQLKEISDAMARQKEQLCGNAAHPDSGDTAPKPARPGEGPLDVAINDKTDLLQGAEEMRLLLGYLYPDQCERWKVIRKENRPIVAHGVVAKVPPTLSVKHEQPGSDSPCVTLRPSGVLLDTFWSTLVQEYRVQDDVVAAPAPGVEGFLRKHTSPEAVASLPKAAIDLFDNHVHDSRCWFRVPYFHEYAPGGYGFPRVLFAGNNTRKAYLGLAPDSAPLALGNGQSRAGWA